MSQKSSGPLIQLTTDTTGDIPNTTDKKNTPNLSSQSLSKQLVQQSLPYDCVTCLNNNLKFCFNSVSTYCCDPLDEQSKGCTSQLDNTLICSGIYTQSKSQKYEICKTDFEKCGSTQIENEQPKYQRELITQVNIQAQDVVVSDDGFWKHLEISPENGIVCSYNFRSQNQTSNVFELKFQNIQNALIGIYYYSTFSNSIIDLGLVDPANCMQIKHCVQSENGYVMFVLDDTQYVSINLAPINTQNGTNLEIDYRLINKEEQKFMIQTLMLMGVGFLLILVLLIVLFKALNLAS
ncbi:UNKNOWN [Stylonychia lemnae]|uniref:Transmembrane protein n=1 Tax=Stylonychia lemnae TaxID=5949 RepID=A0A078AG54_STYLE|nr:UNKNOWN [Stylonychia lemnae]|eukprot:CDW81204.1 UNKNOWN [Stylonychia lemnae]